ncbi:class I SAM-dependent methyltransferase [Hyphomicrobium sp. CS1GBMeth3]|uniref:class I SAM-dependent methyltransferase n=1 Tax=Hyphomicrobium sp. CS1GBMeth3 TaxID=1892845 RepID=UPI0009302374|nr:class I SAM-dependent methyltransferase [Hyphomicrobium sp. CS1GBMeth3]
MSLESKLNRIVSFKIGKETTVRGTIHKVSRRTIVFEIYNPFLLLRTSEVLSDFQIRQGRHIAFQGDAVVTAVVNTSILLVVSATLSGEWSGLEVVPEEIRDIHLQAQEFVAGWNETKRLDPDYRLRVADLRLFLSDLRFWLDQMDLTRDVDPNDATKRASLSDPDFEQIKTVVMPRMTDLFLGLEETCRKLIPDDVELHKQIAQQDLLPLMMPSPFFNRVFTKPLGYAGDYEMVNMMFRNQRSGGTTYAQVVDDWLLAGGPPEAHRNRIHMLKKILSGALERAAKTNKPVRIMNIGCGPAQELQLLLSETNLSHRVSIDLFDFNAETLEYAEGRISPLTARHHERPEITYTLKSVQELLRQAVERPEAGQRYDFVYCAGLFDYLTDRVCSSLVKLFHHWCEPGGRVLVTNVHESNPVKGIMEHVMEWHLVLRDEAGMMRFAPDRSRAKVYCDHTGINVFLELHKPS